MPNARKVIFSTYVVPTQSVEAEETSIRHTEFQASPNGTLGGKGSVAINATQWGDEWTSMEHQNIQVWEDFTTLVWEDFTSNWESAPKGEITITTTASNHQLSSDSNDLAFLYIKNTGSTNNCLVSLNGSSGNFYLIVPPNGAVHLRGDGTTLDCNDVYVKSDTSTTTIEFIIAKTP
tara:strand:+ start:1431 stop:1961 length:531 start_codon:yes stop_codon:yes gene_type:complete